MNADEVDAALVLESRWSAQLQAQWLALVRCAVFGPVASSRLGVLPKVRRRVLETGERLGALVTPRDWIPHPRERLKNALASALTLRDALAQLERAMSELDRGAELPVLHTHLDDLKACVDAKLPGYEQRWAGLLDAQLTDLQD